MQPASTVAKDNREYEKELASTSGLSPKSASPSAAPVPVSQHIKPTRHLDHTRATPPTTPRQPATPRQQAYPVTPSSHHASLVTELETAKQQIKAELFKPYVKVKFDQLTDIVTSLTQNLTEVTKQNKDLKSQIGDLRKYISVIKTGLAKQQTPAAAEIQEPSAPEFPVNNNNTSVNVETSNMFSVLSGEEDDQLTLDNCPSLPLDAVTTYNTDPNHDSTIDSHESTPPIPSAITAPPPKHTDRDARTTRDSPPIRSISTRSSPRHTDRDARTPRERMAECRVSPGKTHVLIGDSVFGQIRPELMYPHKAQQKISVSGFTMDDLLHCLQHVRGEHGHGEHVEGTAQTAQVRVPQCRRPALLSNPATRRAPPEEDGGRFKRCLGEGVSQ